MPNPVALTIMEKVQPGTWSPVPRESLRRFQPDRGAAITSPIDEQQLTDCSYVTKTASQSEKDAIITFYRTTCVQGSLRFDMTDPDSQATAEFKFASPPVVRSIGIPRRYRITLQLVRFDN